MREVVVHVVPVSRQSEDETTDDPLMCMKGTKGKPVRGAVTLRERLSRWSKKKIKNGVPPETRRRSR